MITGLKECFLNNYKVPHACVGKLQVLILAYKRSTPRSGSADKAVQKVYLRMFYMREIGGKKGFVGKNYEL